MSSAFRSSSPALTEDFSQVDPDNTYLSDDYTSTPRAGGAQADTTEPDEGDDDDMYTYNPPTPPNLSSRSTPHPTQGVQPNYGKPSQPQGLKPSTAQAMGGSGVAPQAPPGLKVGATHPSQWKPTLQNMSGSTNPSANSPGPIRHDQAAERPIPMTTFSGQHQSAPTIRQQVSPNMVPHTVFPTTTAKQQSRTQGVLSQRGLDSHRASKDHSVGVPISGIIQMDSSQATAATMVSGDSRYKTTSPRSQTSADNRRGRTISTDKRQLYAISGMRKSTHDTLLRGLSELNLLPDDDEVDEYPNVPGYPTPYVTPRRRSLSRVGTRRSDYSDRLAGELLQDGYEVRTVMAQRPPRVAYEPAASYRLRPDDIDDLHGPRRGRHMTPSDPLYEGHLQLPEWPVMQDYGTTPPHAHCLTQVMFSSPAYAPPPSIFPPSHPPLPYDSWERGALPSRRLPPSGRTYVYKSVGMATTY